MNILFLGAGGPAAVGAIKSLFDVDSQGGHRIISVDCDELAVGFQYGGGCNSPTLAVFGGAWADTNDANAGGGKNSNVFKTAYMIVEGEMENPYDWGFVELDQKRTFSKRDN